MASGKAQDAGIGCSLAKSCNDSGGHFPRNPEGRASFCAMRRYSMAHLARQTSHLVPCLAQKLAPARPCVKREQTLKDAGIDRMRHPSKNTLRTK
jgi:hypothetical protein